MAAPRLRHASFGHVMPMRHMREPTTRSLASLERSVLLIAVQSLWVRYRSNQLHSCCFLPPWLGTAPPMAFDSAVAMAMRWSSDHGPTTSSVPTVVTVAMSRLDCWPMNEMRAFTCEAMIWSRGMPKATCEWMNATRWRTLPMMTSAGVVAIAVSTAAR
eukprot:5942506-Pyramimonas_sp.AAC.1